MDIEIFGSSRASASSAAAATTSTPDPHQARTPAVAATRPTAFAPRQSALPVLIRTRSGGEPPVPPPVPRSANSSTKKSILDNGVRRFTPTTYEKDANGNEMEVHWAGGTGGCKKLCCADIPVELRSKHNNTNTHIGRHKGCCRGYTGMEGGIGRWGCEPTCKTITPPGQRWS